jgi:lipopolysaccharide assembly protein A
MKQINFLILFLFTMALVLFALENTATATIQIIPGTVFDAPLCIELIVAMGIGAAIAWLFSVWTGTQNAIAAIGKNKQIQNLQKKVSQLSVQVEERNKVLTGSPSTASVIDVESEEKTNI